MCAHNLSHLILELAHILIINALASLFQQKKKKKNEDKVHD